jgi:hypothetical protein
VTFIVGISLGKNTHFLGNLLKTTARLIGKIFIHRIYTQKGVGIRFSLDNANLLTDYGPQDWKTQLGEKDCIRCFYLQRFFRSRILVEFYLFKIEILLNEKFPRQIQILVQILESRCRVLRRNISKLQYSHH